MYLIMKNIPVPVSTEDSNSLKSLRSQLKAIGGKVTTKVRAQSDILQRFEHTMATEQERIALPVQTEDQHQRPRPRYQWEGCGVF